MKKVHTVHIGNTIRKAIEESGMTLKHFAEKRLQMTEVGLHKILNKENVNTELLIKIGDALHIPAATLLNGRTARKEPREEPSTNFQESPIIYKSKSLVKVKIVVEIETDQMEQIEEIRNKILLALK